MTGSRLLRPLSTRLLQALPILAATALLHPPAAAEPPPAKPAVGPATAPSAPPPSPTAAGSAQQPPTAAAKKATAADRDAARAFAEQGFEKLQARRYDEAIDLFHKAEERFHAPTHLLYVAQALEKKGQLLEAAETYRTILAEVLPRDAPQPFRDAQADARRALDPLLARTPKLRVDIAGADPATIPITAGDRSVPPGAPVPFDPGTHLVRIAPPDTPPLQRSVLLAPDGREIVVRFDLTTPYSLAIPIVALSLSAAAEGATIAMGIVSHNQQISAIEACRDIPVCPQEQLDKGASGRTLRDAAIVTGAFGGAFLVSGVALFLLRPTPQTTVDPPDADAPAPASPEAHSAYPAPRPTPRRLPTTPTIALRATPTSLHLTGSF